MKKRIPFCLKWDYLLQHLRKDGVHLTDGGTNIFAGNIINYIRHFILKIFLNEVACNDRYSEGQNRGVNKRSPRNKDSNLKNKQYLNPLSVVKSLRLKI